MKILLHQDYRYIHFMRKSRTIPSSEFMKPSSSYIISRVYDQANNVIDLSEFSLRSKHLMKACVDMVLERGASFLAFSFPDLLFLFLIN